MPTVQHSLVFIISAVSICIMSFIDRTEYFSQPLPGTVFAEICRDGGENLTLRNKPMWLTITTAGILQLQWLCICEHLHGLD